MILRNGLQLFVYTLQLIYVFDYVKCTASFETTDSYLEIPRNVEKFSDGTTEVEQIDSPLTNDYSKNDDINTIPNRSMDNFIQQLNHPFYLTDEPEYDKHTTQIPEDRIPLCNETNDKTVRNLTIDSVATEWILLSWQPPCQTAINESLLYIIKVCTNVCDQVVRKDTRYNATDLNPCSEYQFIVQVLDENLVSDGANITTKTNNNIDKIGNIEKLGAHTTTNTISLNWRPPLDYPMCVHNYWITQCVSNNCSNITVVNTEYIAKKLDPCTEYLFIIKADAYLVQSEGVNITLKTNSPKPSKPQDPVVKVGAFSLLIRWDPPEVGSMCVKHYNVTINPDSKTKTIKEDNVTLDGLHACTAYSVSINAVNEDNDNGEVLNIHETTAATVSRPPILNDKETFVTINDIMLSWKIEKGNSSCILKSLKALCNYTSTNGHGYEIINGTVQVPINSCIQDEFLIVNSMIKGLSPFTTYICWAYVVNEVGASELSGFTSITTKEDKPSAPVINLTNLTHSQFLLTWETPTYLAGNLKQFEIEIEWDVCFPIPDWCMPSPLNNTIYLNGSLFGFTYSNAIPYTNYIVKIRAETGAGWGNYSEDLVFQTPPGVPGMVSNLTYLIKSNEDDANVLDTILSWGFPCSLNGMIEYFNISVHGIRTDYTPDSFTLKKYVSNAVFKNDMIVINLKELKAEYNYTFQVSAKVKDVEEFGVPANHNVLYPAGIPPQPDEDYIKAITIDPSKTRRSASSATILLPLFPDTNGEIIYYSIIVSRVDYNIASNTRFNFTNQTWPHISSWGESMLQDFTVPYQATRLRWNPYPDHVADYGEMRVVKYTIGDDTNCQQISSNTNKRVYCNGPLKSDTWYHVRMRAFTRGGYADSIIFFLKTNSEINVGLVIGVIFGILLFGISTTMMLLIRKCSIQVILRRFLHSDMSGSPVPAPFSKKKFIAHCQQLIDNPGKLNNEFQLLQTLSIDLQMPANTACLQANKKKNRYSDVLPYDFSRVKLEVIDNDPNTDYINASFVKGYSGEDEYIACQGPKEETTFDFWRMIEQYNVNLIIMLTGLVEKGKEKCYQYFPTIKETFKYEDMTIKCISELDYRSHTQRTLVLSKENKKRNITHLHYKEWPDHGVPEDFDSMINFCQIVRRNILANKGYIAVHCSAGIGRTGTLIAVDILLQHLRDNRKIDVFGTVYRLRHYRINMVQREAQYAYIYNCIKQVLKNPYCLRTYKPPPMDPLHLNNPKKLRPVPNLINDF